MSTHCSYHVHTSNDSSVQPLSEAGLRCVNEVTSRQCPAVNQRQCHWGYNREFTVQLVMRVRAQWADSFQEPAQNSWLMGSIAAVAAERSRQSESQNHWEWRTMGLECRGDIAGHWDRKPASPRHGAFQPPHSTLARSAVTRKHGQRDRGISLCAATTTSWFVVACAWGSSLHVHACYNLQTCTLLRLVFPRGKIHAIN